MLVCSSEWIQHKLNFCGKVSQLVFWQSGVLLLYWAAYGILPLSSHLKFLVESSEGCGCAHDVPTVLLPDWDLTTIQALVNLFYSGSATVTGDGIDDLLGLVRELHFDISPDQLTIKPMDQLSGDDISNSTSDKGQIKKDLETEKQLSVYSSSISKISSGDKQEIGCIEKKRIKNVDMETKKEPIGVIKKLREVLDIFVSAKIVIEESLDVIEQPLDELISSLKYLPTESSIDILPTEIKTDILSYLCDSGSLVAAAVCLEWKELLMKRLVTLGEIKIGKHCSNMYSCAANKCFMLEEMLKASITIELDVHMKICHPLTGINAELIAESLINVTELSITEHCSCREYKGFAMLTLTQMEFLFETLNQRNDPVKSIELSGLIMTHIDQDKLISSLLRVNKLLLGHGVELSGRMLMQKIIQNTPNSKISQLYLEDLHYTGMTEEECDEIADALCLIETIYLGRGFPLDSRTIERLKSNIINRVDIKMENLFILIEGNWRNLVSPRDLKILLAKLKRFFICGEFTFEKVDAARSIPGVTIVPDVGLEPGVPLDPDDFTDENLWLFKKGFNIDTSVIMNFGFNLSEIFFNE